MDRALLLLLLGVLVASCPVAGRVVAGVGWPGLLPLASRRMAELDVEDDVDVDVVEEEDAAGTGRAEALVLPAMGRRASMGRVVATAENRTPPPPASR